MRAPKLLISFKAREVLLKKKTPVKIIELGLPL